MFRKLGLINRNQRGFTLVELIIAIAVSGVIAGATTGAIFQLMNDSARSNNHMTAVRQVQNAGYWFSRDALMAKSVSLFTGSGFPLHLTRTDFDGNVHQVDYDLVGNNLQRDFTVHDADGALIDSGSSVVAQYIADISCAQYECTICGESFATLAELTAHFASEHTGIPVEGNYEKGALILTATATVGTGPQEESETRVYRIVPRTGL